MFRKELIKQATELYLLGISLESEKQKLKDMFEKDGISAPGICEQLEKVEALKNNFALLEAVHIAETERINGIHRSAGITIKVD